MTEKGLRGRGKEKRMEGGEKKFDSRKREKKWATEGGEEGEKVRK